MPAKKPVLEVNYGETEEQIKERKEALNNLIGEWYTVGNKAAELVAREAELRRQVYDFIYKTDDPRRAEAGTEHWGMPGNWVLKIEHRINAKIDKAALDTAKKLILEMGPDEDGVIPSLDSVIRYEPKLSDAGYREAHPAVRKLLAEQHVVEFNPGLPGIKLELPKSVVAKATPKDE